MEDQWEMIFNTPKLYRAEILKSLLEEENIQAIIINKQDSSYLVIGDIELYVNRDDILAAKRIVNEFMTRE
jgi:hypothetical protein